MDNQLLILAEKLGEILSKKQIMLTTAESCTGGYIAETITSIPGSSHYFERGFVTYANTAKIEMLGVKIETLEKYGAVSEQTVREMAEGAIINSHAQTSIAATGIAGPTGETAGKPVGTIFFAFSLPNKTTMVSKQQFIGSRQSIRTQAVEFALKELLRLLK